MIEIHHGDCIEVMRTLPDNSVDAIVTDPPYELSNDGKSSANRVFAEMVLPKDSHLKALGGGEDVLPLLIGKILELGGLGIIPSPSAPVPVGAVALDNDSTGGDHDVVDGVERAVGIAGDATRVDLESKLPVHLGSFALKLADPSELIEVVGKLGACFEAGTLGVGLGVSAASFPREQGGGMTVVGAGSGVGFRDSALADLVGAFCGTGIGPVFSLNLGRGAEERFTADGARVFGAILLEAGAQLVRAEPPARGLPAVLESRRISVVDDAASRAFTFDLILHTQSISSVGFMGKAWDGSKIAYDVALWREALRVLKPGGHLLAFGGTRTWHRLAVAVEDAGFEIRDSIAWMYGSGFPKSLDVSKAIDKAAGAERTVVGVRTDGNKGGGARTYDDDAYVWDKPFNITAPATPAAEQWQGWGTALKPAFEPIVVGRKPLIGTVAANVQTHGTGALNIDGCRIAATDKAKFPGAGYSKSSPVTYAQDGFTQEQFVTSGVDSNPSGRWPANVALDEHMAAVLDAQSGDVKTGAVKPYTRAADSSPMFAVGQDLTFTQEASSGGASRFFYVAKAPKKERPVVDGVAHPTVKPLALMRWLARLVTPEGGTVLEPFAGSGTTVEACIIEGFNCIAIEREAEFLPLIQARIDRQEEAA